MCNLSIIILFCDKDYMLVTSLIDRINAKIPTDHEILAVDNREKFKGVEIDFRNAKVYTKGYNMVQLESRRWVTQFASGKYIWFVDADDDVADLSGFNFDLMFSYDCDIITGGYLYCSKNGYGFSPQPSQDPIYDKSMIFSAAVFETTGCCLWCKWIKASLLNKVMSLIPENLKVVASEDETIVILALYNAESYIHTNTVFYLYNQDNSLCGSIHITDINNFKHILTGYDHTQKILHDNIPDDEVFKLHNRPKEYNDCSFMLMKVGYCVKEIRDEAFKVLMEYFTEEEILNSFPLFCGWITDKKFRERIAVQIHNNFKIDLEY